MLERVKPDHLVAAVVDGLLLAEKGRRVVAAGLRGSGAAGCCPGVTLGQPDRHGPQPAAGEHAAGRRGNDQEQVRAGRAAHAQRHGGSDHEGPQVQALLGARRHPVLVVRDQQLDRLHERVVRQFRHRHPGRRAPEPRGIGVRPERDNRARLLPVRLQPFEDLLAVVQDGGRGVEHERAVRLELAVVPALIGRPAQRDHVVGKYLPETGRLEQTGPDVVRDTTLGGVHIEADRRCRAGVHRRSSLTRAGRRCPVRHVTVPADGPLLPS